MEENTSQSPTSEQQDDSPLLHVKIMTIGEVTTLARNSELKNKRIAVIGSGFAGHIPALIHAIHEKHPDIDVVVMEKEHRESASSRLMTELDQEMLRDQIRDQMPKKFEITRLEMPMAEVYVKPHNEGQPWKDRHHKNNYKNKQNFKGRGRNNFKSRKR